MEHACLISIAQKVIHTFGKDRQLTLCCAVYSRAHSITLRPGQSARARTKQGRGVIKEIRYVFMDDNAPCHQSQAVIRWIFKCFQTFGRYCIF